MYLLSTVPLPSKPFNLDHKKPLVQLWKHIALTFQKNQQIKQHRQQHCVLHAIFF